MAKYLKRDTELGYIEDSAEIGKEKFNNMRHTILGFMLGDFDDCGKYVLADEIKNELIEMPKFVLESVDNIDICQSVLKLNRPISFMVTFEADSASLILVEKINMEANFKLNSGAYCNVNEFVLDRIYTSGVVDKSYIYRKWNISADVGEVIDIFTCGEEVLEKYFGIVNRFKYLLEANTILLEKEEELEEVEAGYINAIFEILKHYPKLEKAVKEELVQSINEKKDILCLDKPNFAKTLNEILENAIDNNLEILDEKEKTEFRVEKHNAVNEANIKKEDLVPLKVEVAVGQKTDLNQEEIAPEIKHELPVNSKLPTVVVKKQTADIKELTNDFVEERKKQINRREESAVESISDIKKDLENITTEKSKSKKKKPELDKVVETLVKEGVKPETIASSPVVDKADKKVKEIKEENKKTESSAESEKTKTEEKKPAKKEEKTDKKTEVKKPAKKEEKKEKKKETKTEEKKEKSDNDGNFKSENMLTGATERKKKQDAEQEKAEKEKRQKEEARKKQEQKEQERALVAIRAARKVSMRVQVNSEHTQEIEDTIDDAKVSGKKSSKMTGVTVAVKRTKIVVETTATNEQDLGV